MSAKSIFSRFVLGIAGLLVMLAVLSPALAQGGEYDDAHSYFDEASRRLKLQTELPEEREKIKAEDPWVWWPLRFALSETVMTIILYLSMTVIVVLIVVHLRDNVWSSSKARRVDAPQDADISPREAAARMEQTQIEADDLARSGNFAEAIHVLLLRGVSEMRLRLKNPIAASLTSREILRTSALSPEEQAAFADIVGSVEISYFGSHLPGSDEYAACRNSFDSLTNLLRGGKSS
jgi:hypothetical protein